MQKQDFREHKPYLPKNPYRSNSDASRPTIERPIDYLMQVPLSPGKSISESKVDDWRPKTFPHGTTLEDGHKLPPGVPVMPRPQYPPGSYKAESDLTIVPKPKPRPHFTPSEIHKYWPLLRPRIIRPGDPDYVPYDKIQEARKKKMYRDLHDKYKDHQSIFDERSIKKDGQSLKIGSQSMKDGSHKSEHSRSKEEGQGGSFMASSVMSVSRASSKKSYKGDQTEGPGRDLKTIQEDKRLPDEGKAAEIEWNKSEEERQKPKGRKGPESRSDS